MATFGRLLSNPLIIGVLGTKMLSDLSQSYNASQQESEREENEQARRLEMEGQAGGEIPSSVPREGLFNKLLNRTAPLTPYEQAAFRSGQIEAGTAATQLGLEQKKVDIAQQQATSTEGLKAATLANTESRDKATTIFRDRSLADREQQNVISNQIREQQNATNDQIREMSLQSQNEWRDFEKNQQAEKSDDARKANFNQQVNQLLSRQKQVSAMLSSANPADIKTVQSLLDAENGRARTLKEMADKYGYEYDPDQFAPKKIETTSTWGGLGSKSAIVTDTNAAMIGMETAQPDGKYDMNGKRYVVKGGKITGVEDANK